MREILFKAKRVDNGEWVVGQYVNTCYPGNDKETGHFIVVYPNEYHEIYTSTICQFTGLCDRYGNKICENDILKTCSVASLPLWSMNLKHFPGLRKYLAHTYAFVPNLTLALLICVPPVIILDYQKHSL